MDQDLEAIRRARMQELQSQSPDGDNNNNQQKEEQKSREAEARASILSQILEPDAADRLGRIRLVKASRAEDVENRLIMMARSGQLRSRVTEAQLKDILNALSEQQQEVEKVTVQRRKGGWDDDDLDDLLNEDT
ncbi:double-stranded DNA-binding domain-containing protein [Neohortaea acidophila]|uniref:Double-stranded DNA-binding domain-containing protein n=1 Tax=Neohortaea acidophila TaxID=245834 RepID=A0A6A6PPW2_9PEZI|nr:double-stranded DNA-binding domain-containing protein [Neohortaea acidophila]KAF2482062.1 double-stranded DNA-binding domain-containing protein [Neohortaea acidophila]